MYSEMKASITGQEPIKAAFIFVRRAQLEHTVCGNKRIAPSVSRTPGSITYCRRAPVFGLAYVN